MKKRPDAITTLENIAKSVPNITVVDFNLASDLFYRMRRHSLAKRLNNQEGATSSTLAEFINESGLHADASNQPT